MTFKVGQTVLVIPRTEDAFNDDFAGTIKDIVMGFAIVEDANSDCFTVDQSQLELIAPE